MIIYLIIIFTESEESVEDSESAASVEMPSAPPPSFAPPPKPINLTPHQIVIMQPTPEIESRGQFGEEEEEDLSNDVEINENIEDNEKNESDDADTVVGQDIIINTEFKLDKPTRRPSELGLF